MAEENKHVSLKDLQQTVATKKAEAAEVQAQSTELAAENNVPVAVEPDAVPQGEKMLALIGYFGVFCLLPLLAKPDSAFCQFHGKQSLVMALFFLILGGIISFFLSWFTAPYVAHNFIMLVYVVFAFIAMYGAWKGEMKKLPLFGDFVKQLDW